MNARQRLAMAHHCRLACETAHARFAKAHGQYTTVLTVNTGWE